MHKLRFAGILLLCVFIGIFTACNRAEPPTDDDVQKSIDAGFSYLASARTPDGAYQDQYLQFIYGEEQLECPLENCNITYRTLDAYFNLKFIKDAFDDYDPIADDVAQADRVMESLLPIWQTSRLYNIRNPAMRDPEGLALDTYCILGYLYADTKMADLVAASIQGDAWLPENFYRGFEAFRIIADESWCVRHLVKTNTNTSLARTVADKLLQETNALVNSETRPIPRLLAYYHVLLMLHDIKDPADANILEHYQEQIAAIAKNPDVWDDTHTLANVLDALASTGSSDKEFMDRLAGELILRQEPDGKWYPNRNEREDNSQVFATFRAVMALRAYRQ